MNAAIYGDDLAWIHDTGFGEFAASAAPGVIAILEKHGITDGVVVDAGCGSGVLARELSRAGYEVLGFDPSPAMIALARANAPRAQFEPGALDEVVLPPCRAILGTGEVLNYAGAEAVDAFLRESATALPPGGLLAFDLAEAGACPPHDEIRIGGADWSVIAIKESDGRRLTRRVLTFREIDGAVRRGDETHHLELFPRNEILEMLRDAGFRTRIRRSWGTRRLPPGHFVYLNTRT